MKKLLIAVLLMASTQAQAFTEEKCATVTQALDFAAYTETYCNQKDMGLSKALGNEYNNSNCPTFPAYTQKKWGRDATASILEMIDRDGMAKTCETLVKSYNGFLEGGK